MEDQSRQGRRRMLRGLRHGWKGQRAETYFDPKSLEPVDPGTMGDAMATTRVWDRFVRIFHWSLAASFAVAWISGDDWKSLHIWAGYAAGALIAMRLIWGVMGTHYARFSQFVRPPLVVADYLRESRPAGRRATSATTPPVAQ